MRTKILVVAPLLLAGAAIPFAAATAFADVLGPSIVSAAQPPAAQGSDPQAPDPQTANAPTAPAMPADPSYQGQPYVGALTPPPADAMNKTYPLCSGAVQDSCRNANGH